MKVIIAKLFSNLVITSITRAFSFSEHKKSQLLRRTTDFG